MKKDNHWKTLQLLLPVSALVGAVAGLLTWCVVKLWPANEILLVSCIGSLLIYGLLWFVMVRLRLRAPVLKDQAEAEAKAVPSWSHAFYFLVAACLFETCLIASYSGGLLELDAGIYSIFAQILLGTSALVFVVSVTILRIPAKWPFLISTALVLIGGAAYYVYIVIPNLSGV